MAADQRTFTLIGDFQDNITPSLEKINQGISKLKTNLNTLGARNSRKIARDNYKMVAGVEKLVDALKTQNKILSSSIEPMRQYRREVGKTVGALRRLGAAGSRTAGIERTNRALRQQIILLNQLNKQQARAPRMRGAPHMAPRRRERTIRPDVGPRARRDRQTYGGRGDGANFHMAEFAFAFQVGNAISQPITNAIVAGFNIGVQLMMKPFQYFATSLQERIQDEQSDIKAAGGIFAVSKRQKDPLVRTMDEAMEFTQENNKRMAELAAALPGSTQDYIEVSKRISDSVARVVTSAGKEAITYANELRTERGAVGIEGTGRQASKSAYTELLGQLTKQTVLAGLGTGGRGGVVGAYGLPQLTERMLAQDTVSMGQFQRYAAIFRDPLIMESLSRFIPKINATTAGTLDRFKILEKFFKEVIPPEMIRKFERSSAGIIEAFNTAIFGPETGIFGIGRKMKGLGVAMDDFGNYIEVLEDGTRKVVTSIKDATKIDLSLFDLFRDIMANIAIVLQPIIQNLIYIFDPLEKVAKLLVDARHMSGRFLYAFEAYTKGFEDMVKTMTDAEKKEFLKISTGLRGSLAAVNNLFRGLGIITLDEFKANAATLKSTSFDVGGMLTKFIDQFLKSDLAFTIGETIGNIIGTVLTMVAQATGLIAGAIEPNKFVKGLAKGFSGAEGEKALSAIFDNIFKALFDVIVKVFELIPTKGKALIIAAALAPALISATVLGFTSWFANVISATLSGKTAAQCARKIGAQQMCGGSTGKGMGGLFESSAGRRGAAYRRLQQRRFANWTKSQYTSPIGPLPSGSFNKIKGRGSRMPYLGAGLTLPAKAGKGLTNLSKFLAPVGKLAKIGKAVPGGALLFGGVDAGLRMAAGEDAGRAIGGAASSVVGSTLGAILGQALIPVPGLGAAVGGIAGGIIGDKVFNALSPSASEQKSAAQMQLEASRQQMEAAKASIKQFTGVDPGPMAGAITDPLKLVEVLKSKGLQDTSFGKSLTELASAANVAADEQQLAADKLNAKINELIGDGFSRDQITRLDVYRKVQGELNTKNKLLKGSTEKLKTEFDNLPEGLRLMLAKGLNNMTVGQLQAQRIATVNSIQIGAGGVTFSPLGLPAPKTTSSPGFGPEALTTNPKTGLPAWMDPTRVQTGAPAKGSPGRGFSNLYAAAAYESRMKPSGSHLLIANSSETVIPAAGGYGMREFIQTIYSGFSAVKIEIDKLVKQSEKNQASQDNTLRTINQTLKNNQQQTNMRLSKLETKFSTPTMGGLGAGSVGGGVDSFTGLAQQYGLQMTSGYRPGDPGWHGANRARDYSNSTGPTPQMLAFAQALASKYGSSLKELIYTPLGFSIKNGQVVPPIAAGTHYNHVHVAYALGKGTPAFFSSEKDAQNWEKKFVPGAAKTFTSNTSEIAGLLDGLFGRKPKPHKPGEKRSAGEVGTDTGYKLLQRRKEMERQMRLLQGGTSYMSPRELYRSASTNSETTSPVSVNAPITINQQPGQDAEELASLVALKIGEAVSDARASSIFT